MSERQRQHDQLPGPTPAPVEAGSGNLANLQQAGDRLYAAADEAINKVLSGNSLAFNQASRQQNGE